MTDKNPTNEAHERLLDLAIDEALDGKRPPNLIPATLDKIAEQRGEELETASAGAKQPSQQSGLRLLRGLSPEFRRKFGIAAAAACFVAGMALMALPALFGDGENKNKPTASSGGGNVEKHAATGEGGPASLQIQNPIGEVELTPTVVKSIEELDALPADTKAVSLGGRGDMADEAAPKLLRLTALERVDLSHNTMFNCVGTLTDENVGALTALSTLKYLDLSHQTRVTGTGFQSFVENVALETLKLAGTGGLTDDGAAAIARIPNLKTLDITANSNTHTNGLTDAGFEKLSGLLSLEVVNLSGCGNISDKGMAHLAKLPNLVELNLHDTDIRDSALASIANLQTLRKLDLSTGANNALYGCFVGDPMVGFDTVIKGVPFITVEGLAHLDRLPNLENVDLSNHAFDAGKQGSQEPGKMWGKVLVQGIHANNEGLRRLSRIPTLKSIRLANNPDINDDGLRALVGAANLQTVDLTGCVGITRHGMAQFMHTLPSCRITAPEGAVYVELLDDMTSETPVVNKGTGSQPQSEDTVAGQVVKVVKRVKVLGEIGFAEGRKGGRVHVPKNDPAEIAKWETTLAEKGLKLGISRKDAENILKTLLEPGLELKTQDANIYETINCKYLLRKTPEMYVNVAYASPATWLGIDCKEVDDVPLGAGPHTLVRRLIPEIEIVVSGSPAERAGLKVGYIVAGAELLRRNGDVIAQEPKDRDRCMVGSLYQLIQSAGNGDTVRLKVRVSVETRKTFEIPQRGKQKGKGTTVYVPQFRVFSIVYGQATESATSARIGMEGETIYPGDGDAGQRGGSRPHFKITKVYPGSPAEKSGVLVGDTFESVKVNQLPNVQGCTWEQFTKLVQDKQSGDVIYLLHLAYQETRPRSVKITLGDIGKNPKGHDGKDDAEPPTPSTPEKGQ